MGLDAPGRVGRQVQAAAYGQDDIGLGQSQPAGAVAVIECAEGVGMVFGDDALAFRSGDYRGVEGGCQFDQVGGKIGFPATAAGPDERAFRISQQRGGLADFCRVGRLFYRPFPLEELEVGLRRQDIPRDFQFHRAGAAVGQLLHCQVYQIGNFLGFGGAGVPLGNGAENFELVFDFVEGAGLPVEVVAFHLAGNQQHRGGNGVGGAEGGGGVKGAGAGDNQGHADFAGGAGVAVRHISGGLFVADGYQSDAGSVVQGVKGGHQLDAGQPENYFNSFPEEGLNQGLGAGHSWHWREPRQVLARVVIMMMIVGGDVNGGFIRFRLLLAYGSIFPGTMELTVRQKQM